MGNVSPSMLMIVALFWQLVAGAEQLADRTITILWREEVPIPKQTVRRALKPKRQLVALSSLSNPTTTTQTKRKRKRVHSEPHKLRTDKWELSLRWNRSLKNVQSKSMQLEFADNGFVRQLLSGKQECLNDFCPIGKWACSSRGVSWYLSMGDSSELLFHGQLLLNPFGAQPKMIRGIVLDNSHPRTWFRPIVGAFTGEGIGEDTADFTYRNRNSR
ncbi:hypothetical protein ACA910_014085 [Epithemia clementina (nom. ined.)]